MIKIYKNSPQLDMTTFLVGLPAFVPQDSIFLRTSIPWTTCPNTTCLPSNQSVLAVHKKNWDPFELGPELAMDSVPGPECFRTKFSSSNFFPYIDLPPVPLWLVKSPPWIYKGKCQARNHGDIWNLPWILVLFGEKNNLYTRNPLREYTRSENFRLWVGQHLCAAKSLISPQIDYQFWCPKRLEDWHLKQ